MKKIIFALPALSMALAFNASAQTVAPSFYTEVGYASVPYHDSGYNLGTLGVLNFKFGINVHENFAVEGALGTGMQDASFYYGSTRVTTTLNNMYGIYAKPKVKIADNFEVFGRLGYTHINMNLSALSSTFNAYSGSLSYGLGAQYSFTKSVYGELDWMSYYSKNGASGKGPSINVGYKF